MGEPGGFELEPDPPEAPMKAVVSLPAAPPAPVAPAEEEEPPYEEETLLSGFEPRVRKRLRRIVPAMAILYLLLSLLVVDAGWLLFTLVGAAVGVFAVLKRPEEWVLGSVAGGAGFATTLLARWSLPGPSAVIVLAVGAIAGAVIAIDDRMAGA